MEQKPVLSVLFFCALIIVGGLFLWQGADFFLAGLKDRHRLQLPVSLTEFSIEAIPSVNGGMRHRIQRCAYRYQYKGKNFQGHRFSIFDSQRYSRDLPAHHTNITANPVAYIDPQAPMDAVLLVSPPLSALLSFLVGLLFLHTGLVFSLQWLLKHQDLKKSSALWQKEQRIPCKRSPHINPLLIVPGLSTIAMLLFSFLAIPTAFTSQTGLILGLTVYGLVTVSGSSWIFHRIRMNRHQPLPVSWTPRTGLQFDASSFEQIKRARLQISQLRESRFSWRYHRMGQADFESTESFFSLTPYSFQASAPWLWPLSLVSSGLRSERNSMMAESEALCQILAGQNNRKKGTSPLMGLIRKRPDHLLEICIRFRKRKVFYFLPGAFWTSEISR